MQLWRRSPAHLRPVAGSESERILRALERAHSRLLDCLERLDEVTRNPAPDGQRHATCCRDLAQAKQHRAVAVQMAFDHLLQHAGAEQVEELERVWLLGQQTLQLSAEHLSSWPAEAIAWRWIQYHAATRAVRSYWLELVEAEQAVLCRLLRVI